MKIKYMLEIAMILATLMIVGASTATAAAPNLTLSLNATMDGTGTPIVNNITSAVLLNTSGATVATATLPNNMTAQFNLSGISPGDYFIEVNGLAGDHLPTRIDSNASGINQSVGKRLRNSVIGNISNPTYRIKVYPSGLNSHPVVNYTTGLNETIYNFVIVPGNTSRIEVRMLNTSAELSNFTATQDNHPTLGLFPSEPFQIWILGDVMNSTGAFIGNHGHLYNNTDSNCNTCHGNLSAKPSTFSAITTSDGWCFRCHYGKTGPRNGFVDPIGLVAANVTNGTIAGTVTNVSSGLAVAGATVTAGTQSNITDVNGDYSISIAPGTYTVAASATGYQSNTTSVTVTSGATVTQDFALTPTAISPNLTSIAVSPSTVTLNVGATQTFTATALDQSGAPMAGVNISWTSSNMTVGTVSPSSAITDANGNASTIFSTLAAGTAMVNATNRSITGNASLTVIPPSLPQTFNISGFKINDTNGNGVWDSGEMGIENWNIVLKNATTGAVINSTSTGANGSYRFMNLINGSYNVTEGMKTGFNPTNDTFRVVNISGQDITNLNFTNNVSVVPPQTFNISGFKINDTNANGVWDSGEVGIENWNIVLKNATGTEIANTSTDMNGFYMFPNLTNGTYNVTEGMRDGWAPTNNTSTVVTIAGQDIMNLNFTNKIVVPPVVVTSFELIPSRTAALNGSIISITIRALNVSVPEKNFNGMANITINASNNASLVISPMNVSFTDGNATLQVTSSISQFVTVTATNNSVNGSTTVVFADRVFDLNKGWNLISIPNFADPSNVSLALQNVKNNGVVGFDPATKTFSTPTDLQPLFGYWINVTADNQSIGFIASTTIPSLPPTRNLFEGWNLVGVSATRSDDNNTKNAEELFADLKLGTDFTQWLYSRLVSYDKGLTMPETLVAGIDLRDSTPLMQGHGYWLFIKGMPNTNKNNVPWAGKQW